MEVARAQRTIGVPTPHSWCNASKEHDNRQKDPLFESLPSFFLFNSNIFRCYCPKMESKPYWSHIWIHIFFTVISLKHTCRNLRKENQKIIVEKRGYKFKGEYIKIFAALWLVLPDTQCRTTNFFLDLYFIVYSVCCWSTYYYILDDVK